jgi:predicted transcriptional regulator
METLDCQVWGSSQKGELKHEAQNVDRPKDFWAHYLGLLPSVITDYDRGLTSSRIDDVIKLVFAG